MNWGLRQKFVLLPVIFCVAFPFIERSFCQTELQAWGNITGIRVQGELMGFESSLRVVGNQWSSMQTATTAGNSRVRKFIRDSIGRCKVVITRLGSIALTETVTDLGNGRANVITIRYFFALQILR